MTSSDHRTTPVVKVNWQSRITDGRLTRVHNPNGKFIGSAIFAQLTAKCGQACPGMSFPLIIAPSHGRSGPHLLHTSLGQTKSTIQMESQSVQPFLHRSRQSIAILYNGPPLSPLQAYNYPFAQRIWTPIAHLRRFLRPIQAHNQMASRSVQLFLHR